jgi:hypothetical protein
MSTTDSSGPSRAPRPRFVAGVYNYCDHWCERCTFQSRCRVFEDVRRTTEAIARGQDPSTVRRAFDEDDAADAAVTPQQREEFYRLIEEAHAACRVEADAPDDAFVEAERQADAIRRQHPLNREAHEYADVAHGVGTVLRPLLEARADPLALASLEAIERFDFLIAVKTSRAINGLPILTAATQAGVDLASARAALEHDDWCEFSKEDSDCTAKLVRLIVRESREAWDLLRTMEGAPANGVPALMVDRLVRLDAHLDRVFPDAMRAVRMGLDEDPSRNKGGQED